MAECVVLHVGLMKSGTTFLQGRLNANRDLLADQGVLFPGPTWRRHSLAVTDLSGGKGARPGAWASLRDEINAHTGTAIVSMEYLGPMGEPRIATVARDFADADVRVVLTVRDLGRTVPAMWQEAVKNRHTWTWSEYVASVRRGDSEPGRRFWRQQGAPQIARRWSTAFGADNVTVITVPPPGSDPELLWKRFREVAGIAEADWREAPRANESLGVGSVALMGLLNRQTTDLGRRAYKKKVKALAKHVLVLNKGHEDNIGFAVPGWLRQRASRLVDEIAGSGVRVVGDLAELTPLDVPGVDPTTVPPEQVAAAAVAAIDALLRAGGPITPDTARRALRRR